jgi:tRNA A-37 threonylcarbamoyl transferase component Bud32
MSEISDDLCLPPNPGSETKLRIAKARETIGGSDDTAVDPPIWKIGDIVQGFLLEKLLGSGVTSSVYRVREIDTGRIYALKLLRTRCEMTRSASRVGFRRMLPFNHPALVLVDRIWSIGDYIGFTMEEVAGQRLVEVINKTRTQGRDAVFALARRLLNDVGSALQAMHLACLVHRDVKPENVMIDESGQAKLIDYGLVGSWDPETDPDARRNYLAGTYWYMAPESISKQMYPPACDVYALGSIVLELIANRSKLPPEELGVSLGQSIGDVRSFLPSDTPSDLVDLLCDMLDPCPENRPLASRLVQSGYPSVSSVESAANFSCGNLYGREEEMSIAEKWVHSVVDGRPTRLHISGESGVGKSWFLAELIRRIRSNAWFQVFDSTCRERADVPLHAFDAMADGIARRYSRDDREPIRLSMRSALLLRQAFPSLKSIIPLPTLTEEEQTEILNQAISEDDTVEESEEQITRRLQLAKEDSLAAGVDMVDRMCDYGPLILVVDDVQWADQDSINVLDHLLSDANGRVGIITVGKSATVNFRAPADVHIALNPLAEDAAIRLLHRLLCAHSTNWSDDALLRLARLGEGNSYRLTQLAACVSHDEESAWHQRLLIGQVTVEDIWQSRLNHLSDEANQMIETLAIAGGPVRLRDITHASGLGVRCHKAVQELISLRLVVDEAPKRDAVNIVHQRVSTCIIERLDPTRFRDLHKTWADYLISCEHDLWRAARIAGHLLAANEPVAAIPYITQAARDAESRVAYGEAARWHHRASEHLVGEDSADQLLLAINRFEDAGCPGEAADACLELLHHPAMWHVLPACGFSGTTAQAGSLCHSVSSKPLSEVQLWRRYAENLFRAGRASDAEPVIERLLTMHEQNPCEEIPDALLALHRPLMAIDIKAGFKLLHKARRLGESAQESPARLRGAIDDCVAATRNPGLARRRGTERLQCYAAEQTASANATGTAIVNSGLALRHLLACDWASAISPAVEAIERFRSEGVPFRFDEAITYVPLTWSYLWLGRLADMRAIREQMTRDLRERNDKFLYRLMSLGPAYGFKLLDDETPRVSTLSDRFKRHDGIAQSPWLELLQGLAVTMRCIYTGQTSSGLRYHRVLASGNRKSILEQTQVLRVICWQFGALLSLRMAVTYPIAREASVARVQEFCNLLAEENTAYGRAISLFYSAQSFEITGEQSRCAGLYSEAADIADSLDLIPIRLAAIDRISLIARQRGHGELRRFLSSEGVQNPEKFARLYCGLQS